MTIDGTTQPGFAGAPIIEINGANVFANGLVVNATGVTIRGLVINRCDIAIWLLQGNNTVRGCYLGTNVAGSSTLPNDYGMLIDFGSAGNVIGGTASEDRNVISGNGFGVFIDGNNNVIQGNYIGVAANGLSPLGNSSSGIEFSLFANTSGNIIGGIATGEANTYRLQQRLRDKHR